MSFTTSADLVSEIEDWLDDSGLSDKTSTFVQMAEARFNRVLRTPDQETSATLVVSGETAPLPADFREMRAVWVEDSPDQPLDATSLINLKQLYPITAPQPRSYAIQGSTLWVGPVPAASVTLRLIYHAKVPALETNSTNWLLTAHPDAYLLASLVAAELRGWNDERLPLLKAALDEILSEIMGEGQMKRHSGSPLVARYSQRLSAIGARV